MKNFALCAAVACAFGIAQAELPTAAEIQKNMGMGYNIGNSMEVPNDPTAWGNPFPTQDLMDSIKAAGFSTVRIPCAWDSHAPGGVITETWLDSVKTVVDYALTSGLYAILNIHHEGEGGWFQTKMSTSKDANVDTKLKNYWTQIANKFKDYNERLIFAGANEPGEGQKGLEWSGTHAQVLMGYYQTFIDAVRATGGNNASRTLIIQGLQTDIDKSVNMAPTSIFPTDKVSGRLMFEVHYYDNSAFTIMPQDGKWGEGINPTYYYGAEYVKGKPTNRIHGYNPWYTPYVPTEQDYTIAHVNAQLDKMTKNYIDNGYPVIIGEFGALKRLASLEASDFIEEDHRKSRILWHKDVVTSAKNHGITPILWDMGNEGESYDNMAYIRRQVNKSGGKTGQVVDLDVINAMREVYGLGPYANNGVTHVAVTDFIQPGEGTEAISSIQKNAGITLSFQNNSIVANGAKNASIQLFDMNGNLVRSTQSSTMKLDGVRRGTYVAKYSSQVLKISIK